MANIDRFVRRINFISKKINENANQAVRKAALAADQVAVLRTPVDTGRARSNWVVSIGQPELDQVAFSGSDSQAGNEAAATVKALNQANQALSKYDIRLGPIYITNNLEYIIYLDEGSSPQAPDGITKFALQAARFQLKKARLLEGI